MNGEVSEFSLRSLECNHCAYLFIYYAIFLYFTLYQTNCLPGFILHFLYLLFLVLIKFLLYAPYAYPSQQNLFLELNTNRRVYLLVTPTVKYNYYNSL